MFGRKVRIVCNHFFLEISIAFPFWSSPSLQLRLVSSLVSLLYLLLFISYFAFQSASPLAPSSSSSSYLELGASSAAISRASAGRPTSQMRGCWLFKSSPDIPISHTSCSNAVSTFWCCPRPALLLKKVVLLWSRKVPKILVKKNNENKSTLNQSVTSCLETSRYRDFSQFFESISLSLENFGLKKKVSVSVSKIFSLKKSLGIGLKNIWSQKKVSVSVSKTLVSKKVSVSVSKTLVSKKVSVTT